MESSAVVCSNTRFHSFHSVLRLQYTRQSPASLATSNTVILFNSIELWSIAMHYDGQLTNSNAFWMSVVWGRGGGGCIHFWIVLICKIRKELFSLIFFLNISVLDNWTEYKVLKKFTVPILSKTDYYWFQWPRGPIFFQILKNRMVNLFQTNPNLFHAVKWVTLTILA